MKRLFQKYRQLCSYVFWGTGTTIVNYGVYFLCTELFQIHYLTSNVIAWTISVIYAFIVNKLLVFASKSWEPSIALKELFQFVSARLLSGILETALLFIFVDFFHFGDAITKILASVVIVIINYFVSKKLIFKHR